MTQDNPQVFQGHIYRPANTTQYSQHDVVGIATAVVGITQDTATGYCLVEVAASVIDTVLNDKDFVTIASVVGTTEANGNVQITKISATTFTIPVAFANAYVSGGTITKMLQFDVQATINQGFFLNWLKLSVRSVTVLNAQFAVHIYGEPITAIADNAQYAMLEANKHRGQLLSTFVLATGGTGSDSMMDIQDINRFIKMSSSYKRAFFRIVNTSATGWVPASGDIFSIQIGINS